MSDDCTEKILASIRDAVAAGTDGRWHGEHDAPNSIAETNAGVFVRECESQSLAITAVHTSADGGFCLSFRGATGDGIYADIECFNDGSVLWCTTSKLHRLSIFDALEVGVAESVSRIATFIEQAARPESEANQ